MIGLTILDYIIKYHKAVKDLIKNFFSFTFLHILLMFILFLSVFIIRTSYCKKKEKEFFESSQYKDGYFIGKMEQYSYYLDSILAILMGMKLLMFFRLIPLTSLLFKSIEISLRLFVQYIIVVIVLLFGFASIAELIWSPHMEEMKTFGSSFISMLMFTSGYFDAERMVKANEPWSVVFSIFFFVFNLFFIFAVFSSIFAESLRRNIVSEGYPEDVDVEEWTLSDYVKWIVHFTPEKKNIQQQK